MQKRRRLTHIRRLEKLQRLEKLLADEAKRLHEQAELLPARTAARTGPDESPASRNRVACERMASIPGT